MNILLIDDHRLFAESLSLTLKQSMETSCLQIIGSEADYFKLIHSLELSFFDIVLLDINLEMFFASTFWRKMQNIFGECCISKLEKVARPRLAAILPAT